MNRGYRSWFQDLINVWTMPATMLKNKVIYRQFIHSVAFANLKCCTCLRPLYLHFPATPRTSCSDCEYVFFFLLPQLALRLVTVYQQILHVLVHIHVLHHVLVFHG
jgi:hypothetical protein